MNTLLDIFRDSYVLKMAVGIITFLSSTVMTVEKEVNYNPEFNQVVNIELQEKFLEIDQLYFNDTDQTTLQ